MILLIWHSLEDKTSGTEQTSGCHGLGWGQGMTTERQQEGIGRGDGTVLYPFYGGGNKLCTKFYRTTYTQRKKSTLPNIS